ncbi:MAG: DUF4476 domain-containing protein [Bacteroidetes bacterium]|nr:DUF4476 domain-containing protein [Bacteroidota bacterium]
MKSNKTLILLFIFILFYTDSQAQFSNVVVFTQVKEPFTVIMNGIQQSPEPETNVKITGLNAPNYKLTVIFENPAIPEIKKTVYLQQEVENTYEILKNNKGLWVLRLLNTIPLDEITGQPDGQDVYVFTTTPRKSTTTVSQTTTVNTGGLLGGASITTTTTQTTSDVETHEFHDRDQPDQMEYSGPKGCPRPMSNHAFDQALESLSSKSFESSKLTIAKQIAGSNCLLSRQVKEIMKLFSFESDKLEFAKFAYRHTWDLNNYFLLNDAFEFESSIDELNRYINKN